MKSDVCLACDGILDEVAGVEQSALAESRAEISCSSTLCHTVIG